MKIVPKLILTLVILLLLAMIGLLLTVDSLTKKGIQEGGQYALGVATNVQSVKLSLFNGQMVIDNLVISNPEGFVSPHLMKMDQFDIEVTPISVMGNTVQVRRFILNGLDVNIDQEGVKNNFSAVMDRINQISPASGQPKGASADNGKKIKVDRIVIKNVVAHVNLPLGQDPLRIELPVIELDNVSSDNSGSTIAQIMSRVIPATLAAILKEGKDILPADLSAVMNKDLVATAGALGEEGSKVLQNISPELNKLFPKRIEPKTAQDVRSQGLENFLK